ncbi:MAG TPA: hypothetical protein VEF76_14655 [Patescibacteria group bacterium]|nr:hypothetical protein [Patescibacteria group bacterium]
MSDQPKFSKKLLPEAEDLVIRALVPREDGSGYSPLSFTRERIDYVTEISAGVAGIALKNGLRFAVAMDYAALEEKIYFADLRSEPLLDLRDKTGPAAAPQEVPALSQVFADAAAAPSNLPMVDKPLKIAVFVRQSEQQNFKMAIFTDSEIDWAKVDGFDGKNGKATKLPLLIGKGPFGETTMVIDMPRAAFMEIYNKAKMEGKSSIDLRDWTRRRDPEGAKPPAP